MVLTRPFVATPLRLALLAVVVLLVALALLIGWTVSATNSVLTRQVARAISADLSALTDEFDRSGRPGLLAAMEERRVADPNSLYVLLNRKGGIRIAGNISSAPPQHDQSGDGYIFRYVRDSQSGPQERLAAAASRTLADGSVLIVGRDIDEQREYVDHVRRILLGGVVAVALLGLGGGLLVSRHVLRRIDAMTAASRAIMAGDLAGRIPRRGTGDELDRLADSLNAMLARIERLMQGLREVSDNIAHDLKTPLNRLRNHAEAALREGAGSEAWREGLVHTIEEADELIKTFNALLLIAKLEAGALEDSQEPIDLAEVVRELSELYEPAAEEAGFRLEFSASGHVPIRANRQLISQAVANLIDNAIKYSATGAKANGAIAPIRVTVAQREGDAEVVVADRGPGIAAADRPRALKRFVRLEASRSRPGTGLGLSLVTAVAQMHGGSVRLEDNAPGLRAVLSLPLDRSRHADGPRAKAAPVIADKVDA
jgi:signal transduction histidine kinase